MEDVDIKKIRKILEYRDRQDLSDLLINSTSYLDVSNSYGSRSYSLVSVFEIKSHPKNQALIDKLSKEDKNEIFDAVLKVYPVKDEAPEIREVTYFPDFDIVNTELVETKELERISFEYIHEQIKKCNSKIAEKDFEGSITNARTLIESICLYIIESKTKEKYEYDGNLFKLYRTVANLLNISPANHENEFVKQLLSGVFSIINGVSGLRNSYSDSHGNGPSKSSYKIDERNAVFTVNLAKIVSEYLFVSFEQSE